MRRANPRASRPRPVPVMFGAIDLRAARTLRFALGVTLSVVFAYALEYSSFSLTTVLVATLLAAPAPRPGPRALAGLALSIAIALGFGVAISMVLLTSPLLFVLATGLLLFHIFYAATGGAPPFAVLMLLLGVILIPVMGSQSLALAVDFAGDFFVAASLALGWVLVAFAVIPDPVESASPLPGPAASGAVLSQEDRTRLALRSVTVVLPLVMLFLTMQWVDKLTALLFVAILAMAPGAAQGRSAGIGMLVGTLIGGGFALVIYVLTSLHYSYVFLCLLVLLACLMLGRRIFSETPSAALFAKAPASMLILISSVDPFMGGDTNTKFFLRIQMVVFACVYIVLAFQVLDVFETRRQKGRAPPEASQLGGIA